jgi:high-affinity Fe2+/Pb2+ permease
MVPTSKSTVSYLVLLALAMYFLFDKWLFHRLSNEKFKQVFGPILVLMSALLLLRAWM